MRTIKGSEMNQDEFNDAERESKMRIEAVYQELQKYREKMIERTWVGLTDEEIASIYMNHTDRPMHAQWDFARAIEAKYKEKNT
jgi:hypothetical protein